jgi:flagellar motor switch/type III secretory pathway protein FliN
MKAPRVRSFPCSRLERIDPGQLDLRSRSSFYRWLGRVSEGASQVARSVGLGALSLEIARVKCLRVEDLRSDFPGQWRFAVFHDPLQNKKGFLALDPLLAGRSFSLVGKENQVQRGWTETAAGEMGIIAFFMTAGLESIASREGGEALDGWRFAGISESVGEVGRTCSRHEFLIGTWLRVEAGWDKGFAVWITPHDENSFRAGGLESNESWNDVSDLRLRLVAEYGRARLTVSELEGMGVGDVVVLSSQEEKFPVVLRLGSLQVRGTVEGTEMRIEEIKFNEGGDQMNPGEIYAGGGAQDLDAAEVAELPVGLIAEAGRLDLTVSQVARLMPGDVLAMPQDVLGPVDLRSGERLVARGELVDVGGKRGVRLLEVSLARSKDDEINT